MASIRVITFFVKNLIHGYKIKTLRNFNASPLFLTDMVPSCTAAAATLSPLRSHAGETTSCIVGCHWRASTWHRWTCQLVCGLRI